MPAREGPTPVSSVRFGAGPDWQERLETEVLQVEAAVPGIDADTCEGGYSSTTMVPSMPAISWGTQ